MLVELLRQKQAFHLGSFELVTLQSESDKYSKNIPIVGTHYDKDLEWAKSWDFGNPNLFCYIYLDSISVALRRFRR